MEDWHFFRVYSGKLDAGSYVLNNRSGNKERISRIFQMHADKQNSIPLIEAGDIGAAVGFKDIKTGDTLSAEKSPIVLESMVFPDPVIGIAVEPKTKADVDKLGMALGKLAEEDQLSRLRQMKLQVKQSFQEWVNYILTFLLIDLKENLRLK